MKIVNKKLSLDEFEKYVKKKNFGKIPPTFIVLHHTWKPDVKDWQGQKSINGLKSYYERKGWTAGPHLFIAEDGIWLFTDMYEVGIHAGVGNGNLKTGYSVGIEVVGNYDNKEWSGKTKKNAIGAINTLLDKLKLKKRDIHFHSEYSAKTCPGLEITKGWLKSALDTSETEPLPVNAVSGDQIGVLSVPIPVKVESTTPEVKAPPAQPSDPTSDVKDYHDYVKEAGDLKAVWEALKNFINSLFR